MLVSYRAELITQMGTEKVGWHAGDNHNKVGESKLGFLEIQILLWHIIIEWYLRTIVIATCVREFSSCLYPF